MRLWIATVSTYSLFAQSLLQTADSLFKQGKYILALPLYDSLLRTQLMPDTLRLYVYLRGAEAWESIQKPQEALRWIAPAESLVLRLRDTLHYAEFLGWEGSYHRQLRDYARAKTIFQKALRLAEDQGAQKSVLYASLWRRSAGLALEQREYESVREYLHRAAQVLETIGLTEHPEYASVLHGLGILHHQKGRYAEAEAFQLRAKEIRARVLGTNHPDYASTLNNLALIYSDQGRYAKAESLYIEAKTIRGRALGTDHPSYALTINNLAAVYRAQGKYAEAESLYLEAKAIRAKSLGTEHPQYAMTLNTLAILYKLLGRYAEAEALFLEAKAIRAKALGTNHPDYANTLSSLASLYSAQGRYTEAEALYLEAKAIRAKVLGTDHPEYATTLNNLASLYSAQGRYAEAEALYLEAKAIRAKALGTDHPEYASLLSNLAVVYYAQGRYAEAEALYSEVRAIQAKALGTSHPDYALTLNNLAIVYYEQGRYAEAEALHLEAKALRARALGTDHPDYYYHSLYNLAHLYQRQRRYNEADTLWQTVILKSFDRIRREFPTLSTAARQNLLENIIASRFVAFQRYVAERRDCPELVELGYRATRSFKGLLLTSTEAMKNLVESSRDSALQARYRQWKRLADLYASFTLQQDYRTADSLWKQLQEAERTIVQQLPALKDFLPDPAGEPLLPPLRPDESLVEVVRVPPERKEDSLLYLFYMLVPSGKKHRLQVYVHVVDTLWERRVQNAYEILRSPNSVVSGVPYRMLWGFLDTLIPPKVRALYFAPDGVYYRVNIATLYDAQRKLFVADRYEVRYIASSRRLLLQRGRFPAKPSAVVGNPDFSAMPDTFPKGRIRSYRLFEGGIPPLPGAEIEAKGVAQLLGVQPVIGKTATEAFLKQLQSPQVLHVATHGYFTGEEKNPLLAGGLLLAQAAVWDSLFPPLGIDDGRLTAQEASNLNLLGTELVVLSACETGLGEVRGEGLYGLQRAFLEAGAQRVITTLWQIDDEATRELMLGFYQNWVKHKREESVDVVFNRTLKTFRQKYSHPYYWGAFVVMR